MGPEVVLWGGKVVGLDRTLYMAWIWKGVSAESGLAGGGGVEPWMKLRSVFGTCMVSGIRRREKVRE